jgi:hypothetical protein
VQGISVNGKASRQAWLSGSTLIGDGRHCGQDATIDYRLSSNPDKSWGSAPRSYPAGPVTFTPGVTPVELTSTPDHAVVAVGAQIPSTLKFAVGAGALPAKAADVKSLTWTALPPTGVTVTPDSGTVPVAADGTATATVFLSASAEVVQGFTSIPFTLSSASATELPRLDLPVALVGAGDTAGVCTTLGEQTSPTFWRSSEPLLTASPSRSLSAAGARGRPCSGCPTA